MAQIFISYRRSETGYVATMLADEIKAHFGDDSVFMDIDNIPLGVDFREQIGSAVAECQVLLALIGDDWLTSTLPDGTRRIDAPKDFVRVEIEAALERHIPVIPILTSEARIPTESELPPSIRALAFRNATELRSGRDLRSELQGLCQQLSSLLKRKKRRSLLAAVGIPCAIAVVAVGAILAWKHFPKTEKAEKPETSGLRSVTLIASDPIPLYKEADPHSEKVGALGSDSSVIIDKVLTREGKTWSHLKIKSGWVAARNMTQPDYWMVRPVGTKTLQNNESAIVSYTGPDGLNLRVTPDLQTSVIAILLEGTQLRVNNNDPLEKAGYEWIGVTVPPVWISDEGVTLK